MGAHSETVAFAAEDFATLPFDPAQVPKYNALNSWMIDPSKQYPKCYEEFMTSDGLWDLYGNFN